jgi:hypothetical protein
VALGRAGHPIEPTYRFTANFLYLMATSVCWCDCTYAL